LGVIVGGAVNGGLLVIGPMLIPPPDGVDMTTVEGMIAGMHLLGPEHFAVPFLAHALGTLVAYFVAASQKILAVYFIGVLYLIGGLVASTMIPAPVGFILLDLIVAYLPMAWLALKLGGWSQRSALLIRLNKAKILRTVLHSGKTRCCTAIFGRENNDRNNPAKAATGHFHVASSLLPSYGPRAGL